MTHVIHSKVPLEYYTDLIANYHLILQPVKEDDNIRLKWLPIPENHTLVGELGYDVDAHIALFDKDEVVYEYNAFQGMHTFQEDFKWIEHGDVFSVTFINGEEFTPLKVKQNSTIEYGGLCFLYVPGSKKCQKVGDEYIEELAPLNIYGNKPQRCILDDDTQ